MTPAGRPEIGQPINVRIPEDLLGRVDAVASYEEISRAEAVRRLLTVGLFTAGRMGLSGAVEEAER